MAKLTSNEVLSALELMTPEHPIGVFAEDLWNAFFKDQCEKSQVSASLSHLFKTGHVTRIKGMIKRGATTHRYLLSGKKYEPNKNITFAGTAPIPRPVAPTVPLKKVNLKELRAILDKTIDALETIQDQLQPLLAKLLDLARDCDKLEQVRDIINGMKKLVV